MAKVITTISLLAFAVPAADADGERIGHEDTKIRKGGGKSGRKQDWKQDWKPDWNKDWKDWSQNKKKKDWSQNKKKNHGEEQPRVQELEAEIEELKLGIKKGQDAAVEQCILDVRDLQCVSVIDAEQSCEDACCAVGATVEFSPSEFSNAVEADISAVQACFTKCKDETDETFGEDDVVASFRTKSHHWKQHRKPYWKQDKKKHLEEEQPRVQDLEDEIETLKRAIAKGPDGSQCIRDVLAAQCAQFESFGISSACLEVCCPFQPIPNSGLSENLFAVVACTRSQEFLECASTLPFSD